MNPERVSRLKSKLFSSGAMEGVTQVEVFVVADAATHSSGKLNILGSFDTFFSDDVPFGWPLGVVAARIRIYKRDGANHHVVVQLLDPRGKVVEKFFEDEMKAPFVEQVDSAITNLIVNIQGYRFEEFGEYSLSLKIDKKQMATIPLFVSRPIPSMAGPGMVK